VREVRRRGIVSQTTLRQDMGIARSTMHRTIVLLRDHKLVTASEKGLSLDPELGILVGVDISHATAKVAISNLGYDLRNDPDHDQAQREITIGDPETSLEEIASLVAQQLKAHIGPEHVRERLVGVGIVLPGPILREPNLNPRKKEASDWDRRVQAGRILPGWDNVPVAAKLATLLKDKHGIHPPRHNERRVVWVENDASAGALGIHTEAKRRLGESAPDDLIYVRLTTGIGAGIINKGHLVTGSRGFAGEIGHVAVDPAGAMCTSCGGRGCLETLVSNRAIVEQLRALVPPSAHRANGPRAQQTGYAGSIIDQQFAQLLNCGHPAVDRALWDAGWHLGTLLASICCVLNPSWIVLDGEAPEHEPGTTDREALDHHGHTDPRPFVAAVRHAIHRNAMPQVRHQDHLHIKTLKDVVSEDNLLAPQLLGALALVVDHLGDGFLLTPITRWINDPKWRDGSPSFT